LKFIGHLGKFDNLEDHSGIMMIYLLQWIKMITLFKLKVYLGTWSIWE
jgi:hypothetical protein